MGRCSRRGVTILAGTSTITPYSVESRFLERYLHDNEITHTLCTVGPPQSNGKSERFFQTYEKHRWRFDTLDDFSAFYNQERPHMSLNWDNLETAVGLSTLWRVPR